MVAAKNLRNLAGRPGLEALAITLAVQGAGHDDEHVRAASASDVLREYAMLQIEIAETLRARGL